MRLTQYVHVFWPFLDMIGFDEVSVMIFIYGDSGDDSQLSSFANEFCPGHIWSMTFNVIGPYMGHISALPNMERADTTLLVH